MVAAAAPPPIQWSVVPIEAASNMDRVRPLGDRPPFLVGNSDDLTMSASAAAFAESRHRDPFRTVAHCDTLELAN
jgi:hypothetical protein